ncbi:MAG: peptidyl-prolyl cis-trans isomerase [Fimbriimonadaceae bacterium]
MKVRSVFTFVFGALAMAQALAQVDLTSTIVVINGEEVKGSEYYRRMEFLPGVGKQLGNGFAEFPPGLLTIEQLVTERLILQMAKDKGVLPTAAEVKDEIAYQMQLNPDYTKSFLDTGQTLAELDYQTKVRVARFKLTTFGITVTDAEVAEFYKKNSSIYSTPKMVTLKVIAVDTEEKAKAVDADLAAGKSFSDVAKARSLDVSAATGGEFGRRPYFELAEIVRGEVDKIKVGGITEWIVGEKTRVKFMLVAADPEKARPLDDVLKKIIRREILITRGSIKNNIRQDMIVMRKKAQISITQKEFDDAYKKFIDVIIRDGG